MQIEMKRLAKSTTPERRKLQRWQIISGIAILVVGTAYTVAHPQVSSNSEKVDVPAVKTISALGRLEPKGEVIQLAATNPGSRISELLVKVGDRVKKGQVIRN